MTKIFIFNTAFLFILINSQISFANQIIFDNSITNGSYYNSSGSFISPSKVELTGDKLPVSETIYYRPPNALKLKWISKTGGNWEAVIEAGRWHNKDNNKGDTFSFWCYSKTEISAHLLPNIRLRSNRRGSTVKFRLGEVIDKLPSGKWTQIKIPLSKFGQNTREFDFSEIRTVMFTQCIDDGAEHSIYLDEFKVYDSGTQQTSDLTHPAFVSVIGFERHFDLEWKPIENKSIQKIIIYRSLDGKNFQPIGVQSPKFNRYSDYVGKINLKAYYKIATIDWNDNHSELSSVLSSETISMNDDQLLDMVQQACFRYYWESAHPNAGLALENVPGDENLIAVGASGFGIMATVVAVERGFITRDEGLRRFLKITKFLNKADRFHGAFPHYLDGRNGKVIPRFGKYDNGGDLVETSFLIQGLLIARQYFKGDSPEEIMLYKEMTHIWETVEWDWYRREADSDFLYWHWSPDHHWQINHPLVGWNETMITYICAIASPTHPVPAELYYTGWAGQSEKAIHYRQNWGSTANGDHYSNGKEYYGIKLDVGVGSGGPLFFLHYNFMGLDPIKFKDKYTNYFKNSRNIALINHAYCINNPRNYKSYSDSSFTGAGNPDLSRVGQRLAKKFVT